MFGWFKRKKKEESVNPLIESLNQNKCPDCDHEGFITGPEAGVSVNIECGKCGNRFNIAAYDGKIFHVERIGHRNTGKQWS